MEPVVNTKSESKLFTPLFKINILLFIYHVFNKFALLKILNKDMKKDIHPKNYRLVVFKDLSNDQMFITRSCVETKETIKLDDGKEYPYFKLEISNTSHPFFTGKKVFVDTAGRVEKFFTKYKKEK
jgi:large subunit ribosomal protein L31